MRARHWWGMLAAATAVALVVGGGWVALGSLSAGRSAGDPAGASDASDATVSTASASSTTPVCGFAGTLVDKITANRPAGTNPPALDSWRISGDGTLGSLAVADGSVVVDRDLKNGSSEFLRYSLTGKPEGTITVPIKHEGRWALADDGSLFLVDSYHGSTRRIVHLAADGSRLGSFDVPKSRETTGHPLDLQYLVWVPQYKGSGALLIGEGTHTVHVMRASGANLGVLSHVPDVIGNSLGGGLIAGYSTTTGSAPLTTLEAIDLTSGATRLHAVYPASGGDGSDAGDGAVPTTPSPYRLSSVVPGPAGTGYLLSTAYGVQWIDDLGVRKGVWLSGQDGFSPADPAAMVESGGRYWMLVKTGDDAVESVATLSSAQMASRIASPLLPTADVEPDVAQLGLGIGAVTRVAFNHFDAGRAPAVYLRTEKGWGDLPGARRPGIEVRYTVTGDPTLADPISSAEKTVAIPWGGGQSALQLPTARPGPYEVSLAIVETASNTVLSGSCLHYSVGAADADLRLSQLPPGDDWGGPAPLRGVQLAATLGIYSDRVQLDFGSLIPDAKATPSPAAIQWWALPGANLSDNPNTDPFQNLREAGAYAERHGVRLIVQVGDGGDAEKAAVASGTWAGWVRLIVEEFKREAPSITSWEAYNEPNSFYDSADEYWKTVEIPFADAAHAADPKAYVIAGNTLGFENDWWKKASADGVCSHVNAVGVHPYTGWNRSWEEEGFAAAGAGYDAFRKALGPACASLPIWDTESGWTSDSASAYWAQGSNVTRKLLWYKQDKIAGWTYFYSEGGWGENDSSWSLIQYRSYVKPGGLAFATVSRLLQGRGVPVTVATGIPFAQVMRVPGDDTMLVAWTDEARLSATLTTDASTVRVTDEYGSTAGVTLSSGSADVTLTSAPQFFRAAAGSTLGLRATEAYGPDLLKGRSATASSTFKGAKTQTITSGTADPYRPWRSGAIDGKIDPDPTVTIGLKSPTTIDRIAVATGNIACCEAGLRGYTVSVQKPDGSWQIVASPTEQFWYRTVVFKFDPIKAKAVRVRAEWTTIRDVKMLDMNYTGFAGGLPPPFMGLQTQTDYVMSVSAVSAWAPASSR
ncbi:galactose-binding domain-containing protein [Humibacter sp.]|uniref:galactose-binding domain-containing protein n=1 Tax=Humibacter sp. TaxID=1940291 RepID=UPI003F7E1B69